MSTLPNAPTIAPDEAAAYERDFYSWCLEQAALIRTGRLDAIDVENVAEEIESLGNEQFAKLVSAYAVLLLHMLKWDHQPERRSRSWANSIVHQRHVIDDVLDENPGLKPRVAEAIRKAYRRARLGASTETDRPVRSFPEHCPFSTADIHDRPFLWDDEISAP